MAKFKKSMTSLVKSNLTLTVKWTLLTSVFIFVLFSTFAIITYKSSTEVLVKEEQTKLKQTHIEVEKRLSESTEELTPESVVELLKKTHTETTDNKKIELNSFIAELSRPEVTTTIYNFNKEIILETRENNFPYKGSLQREIQEITLNGKDGFILTQPVMSQANDKLIGYIQLFYDMSVVQTVKSKLLGNIIVLMAIGLLVTLLLGFLLSSYFLRPLRKITNVINEIKTDPQAEIRIPEMPNRDEFGDLADVFNDMMDRMQRFIEQQQQFVEDVSHELRTPVAIIEGHLKLLNRWGKDDPEVLEESLEASLQEIIRMKSLVQEMLDLSRLEQVEFQHKNDISHAKEVMHQTFNNFKILHPEFTFILDDDLYRERQVKIYRHHFEQLLIILLDNAVKYSTDRKEIHLSLSSTRDTLEIAIQDFGEGISTEDLDQVFNRFYRVDKARSRHKGGNGLGLSIARELVESYGGHILAESAVGVGTIFRIELPLVSLEPELNA
ncbi:HAMP domain-containing histidine kinase [Vagococcus coleopterorum]|uniref:Signal transduction histidine-protein kinase ArlS n=1 Tax=Vagococcus coleopterorum TaxID=2714946 RepID=A0A6G8AMY4_9ENTE|nr:HAMP domain-containing histidine kinase [Vagococcus coleopterorum]QIL46441.1 HAMP domain-containing histidine kinase [Vagococcus coleopterorum]